MSFTDLEYVLMIAVAVLLWRNASVKMWAEREERRANKYSRWLIGVYEKKGKIVQKDDGYFFEEIK
jgi:hypothetical protein